MTSAGVAPTLDAPLLDALRQELLALDRVAVAFSGGADSALLAHVAHATLGADRCLVVTAVSPSLAADERTDCAELAAEWGLRWREVATAEMEAAAYRVNDGDRCFHCKSALMDAVGPLAAEEGATVVLGVNLDDLGDHRPGQAAAAEAGAVFPLVRAGFTKAEVRRTSQALGLRTWDKPAAACLASRVPYGTSVSVAVLSRVERGRGGAAAARVPGAAGAPLRRHRPPRGAARRPGSGRGRQGGGRRGGAGRGVPLRHPRPRGPEVGQPQPGPRPLTAVRPARTSRRRRPTVAFRGLGPIA